MKREQFTFTSARDGLLIHGIKVIPDAPKAVLQMAHGMAEHKERYIPMMEYFASKGYLCVMSDHRGHGDSLLPGKPQGHFGPDGGRCAVDDLHQLTGMLRAEHPDLPIFLFGHSMGSLAVRAYRCLYGKDVDGYVLSGSPAGAGVELAQTSKKLIALLSLRGDDRPSPFMAKLSTGGYSKPFRYEGSPSAWLSTDPKVAKAYDADPQCGYPFTLNGYRALMDLIILANGAETDGADRPVYFLSGGKDPCMGSEKALAAIADAMKAQGSSVGVKVYPMLRHELHNEPGHDVIFDDTLAVLDSWL